MKLKKRLDKKIDEILEKDEKCCINCHHCIPKGLIGKWTYVAICDAKYGFKGEKSLFSLIRKYKNKKYPFSCICINYDGGP